MPNKKPQMMPFEGETTVALFKDKAVRRSFHNDEWYFSLVDVIAAITDSASPSRYWTELRTKLLDEGYDERDQPFGGIERLKMTAADGKERETDAANTETLFRIIQSIPSPKAEPFKRWLAKVAFERLQETRNPELAVKRAMVTYRLQGYPDDWINARIKTIVSRNELTSEWARRGVKEGIEYAVLTSVISEETFSKKPSEHKDYKGLSRNDNLRDHMTDIELILTMLGEKSTTSIAVARDAFGFEENKGAARSGGMVAGDARRKLERELGRSVVSPENYLPESVTQDQLVDGAKELFD